jgi:hypothetical protein
MKIIFKLFLFFVLSFLLFNCSVNNTLKTDGSQNIGNQIQKGYIVTSDAQEGTDPDLKNINIYYNSSNVYIYIYFYNAVSIGWGDPYIYLYDTINNNDRDMIIFTSETTYSIRRDQNADGYFETTVYNGTTMIKYNGGLNYTIVIPKSALPDIGSKNIWAYSMTSTDRLPNTGSISFNTNTSTSMTDTVEGVSPDFIEIEAGYDELGSYLEINLNTAISSLSWGNPYIYFYDTIDAAGRYMIAFNDINNFEVRQDQNADGYFETYIYSGTSGLLLDSGKRFVITMPLSTIPSLSTKNIWTYSMTSYDRIPDSGYLTF